MELTTENLPGGSITRIQGALDGQTYQQFTEEVKKQIAPDGKVILDFQSVDSVNAEGLRALLALNHWIKAKNGALVVAGLSGKALEAFKSSGCDRLLKSYADVTAARQAEGLVGGAPPPSAQTAAPVRQPEPAATRPASPPPVDDAAEEWGRKTVSAKETVKLPSPTKKGFPLLPVVAGILGLAGLAGLAMLFWPKDDGPEEPESDPDPVVVAAKPEFIHQAKYELTVGKPAEIQLQAKNCEKAFVESGLPEGLAMSKGSDEQTWLIAGAPTKAGQSTVTVGGLSADKAMEQTTFEIVVTAGQQTQPPPPDQAPKWIDAKLVEGTIGKPYTDQVLATGNPAYSANGLPPGLKVGEVNGSLEGTPEQAGSFAVTLTASNPHGASQQAVTVVIRDGGPLAVEPGEELENVKKDLLERLDLAPVGPDLKKQLRPKIPEIKQAMLVATIEFPTAARVLDGTGKQTMTLALAQPKAREILQTEGWVWFSLGYADTTGDPKANYRISEDRAKAVADAMTADPGFKRTVVPVAMGPTDKLTARRDGNRRVEIWAIFP